MNDIHTLALKFFNDELDKKYITKDILIYAYLNLYEEEFLYEYPDFFYHKLINTNILSDNEKNYFNNYFKNKKFNNKNDMIDFFNDDYITVDMLCYVGW